MTMEKFKKFIGNDVKLTGGQWRFIEMFLKGNSIYLHSAAGCGKSFILKKLSDALDQEGIFHGKTSMTGVSALSIDGRTLHSWMGLGLGDEHLESLLNKIRKNKKAVNNIRNAKCLIIDEISMCGSSLFDKIDIIFKYFKFNNKPFGGCQILLSGDFAQLGFINKFKSDIPETYVFNSRAWKELKIKAVELTEPVRQKNKDFFNLLNRIRVGDLSDLSLLESRVNAKLNLPDGLMPVTIFSKNVEIDKFNEECLSKIPGKEVYFYATDTGEKYQKEFLNKNCQAAAVIKLKKGAQCIILANIDQEKGVVNGALCKIIGFTTDGPIVRLKNGQEHFLTNYKWEVKEKEINSDGKITYKVISSRTQIPIRVAFASSAHKMQGQTLDAISVDLSNTFSAGQAYVSLSRCKDLEGLTLKPFSLDKIIVDPECLQFYKDLEKINP